MASHFPDVREEKQRAGQRAQLDQATRAEAWTQSAAFAFGTGDLAKP
jgi:hypothetical protein